MKLTLFFNCGMVNNQLFINKFQSNRPFFLQKMGEKWPSHPEKSNFFRVKKVQLKLFWSRGFHLVSIDLPGPKNINFKLLPWWRTTLTKYAFPKSLEAIFSNITPLNVKISTFLDAFIPKFLFQTTLASGTCGKINGPFLRHGCTLSEFAKIWPEFQMT